MRIISPSFIGFVAVVGVAIWILAPLVELSLPLHHVARVALRRELRRKGLRHLIPRACVAEIAHEASRTNLAMAEKRGWSVLLIKDSISSAIEADAKAIRDWLYGVSLPELPKYLICALRKYAIPFGLLAARSTTTRQQ